MIKLILQFLNWDNFFFNVNILYFHNTVNPSLEFEFYIMAFAKIVLFFKRINTNIVHFGSPI